MGTPFRGRYYRISAAASRPRYFPYYRNFYIGGLLIQNFPDPTPHHPPDLGEKSVISHSEKIDPMDLEWIWSNFRWSDALDFRSGLELLIISMIQKKLDTVVAKDQYVDKVA